MSNCVGSIKQELPSTQFPQMNVPHTGFTFNDEKIDSAMSFGGSGGGSGVGLLEDLLEESQVLASDVNSNAKLTSSSSCLVSSEEQRLFDGFHKLAQDSNTACLFFSKLDVPSLNIYIHKIQ